MHMVDERNQPAVSMEEFYAWPFSKQHPASHFRRDMYHSYFGIFLFHISVSFSF